MAKRDWLIPPRWLGVISLIIVAYACIAIWHGGIITYWQPGQIDIGDLLIEVWGLWWLLCLGAGVLAHKQPCSARARYWPIVVVSFVLSAGVGGALIWKSTAMFWGNPQFPVAMRFGLVGGPVLLSTVPSFFIWSLARLSRWLRQTQLCLECGYDLTGNTSGRCPECGRLTDASPSKRFLISTRWYPELNLFETTAQRDETWRLVHRELNRDPRTWAFWVVWAATMVCFVQAIRISLGLWWWLLMSILGSMTFAGVWTLHRTTRRLLCRKLIEAGIPVCLRCGRDLRDESAEACRECGRDRSSPEHVE